MSTGLMVDDQNKLKEVRSRSFPEQPVALQVVAKIISYIFHPVFVPVMVVWFFVFVHPNLFVGIPDDQKFRVVAMAAVSFTFFPLVTVLLLRGLKFIDTIYLHTQRDRVIPFIACMIWYFWIWYVWNNFGKTDSGNDMPRLVVQFAFAAFLSTILGVMVNIRMKVSLHAISAGIALTLFAIMALTPGINLNFWFAIVLLLTGIICTARFIVSDHTPQEVYGGLALGAASMLIANFIG